MTTTYVVRPFGGTLVLVSTTTNPPQVTVQAYGRGGSSGTSTSHTNPIASAITPWFAGDTAALMTIQLMPDSGYVDVTGLTTGSFTLLIRNINAATEVSGQGTFSALTAAVQSNGVVTSPASVQYQFSASDAALSTPGLYHLYLKVQFGTKQQTYDIGAWQVVTS